MEMNLRTTNTKQIFSPKKYDALIY